jgi:hypothetical protein
MKSGTEHPKQLKTKKPDHLAVSMVDLYFLKIKKSYLISKVYN